MSDRYNSDYKDAQIRITSLAHMPERSLTVQTKRPIPRVMPLLIVFVCLVGCSIVWFKVMSSAAVGSVQPPSEGPTKRQPVSSIGFPVRASGNQADFNYPSQFRANQASQPLQAPALEVFSYSYQTIPEWHLNITVVQLKAGSITADSSFQLRASEPERYRQSNLTINNRSYVIMQDLRASGFAEVAYSLSGTRCAEISLMGDSISGLSGLDQTWQMVLSSWTWHTPLA